MIPSEIICDTVRDYLRRAYRVSENFIDIPKSRVVVGYDDEESNGVLTCWS